MPKKETPKFPEQKCDGSVSCAPANQNKNASAGSGRKTDRPAATMYRGKAK